MFNPATSNGLESALLDFALDAVVQRWVELLEPLELLGLRTAEAMLRVPLHEVALVGPGSSDLALGLGPRPQPAGVDVAVSDGGDNLGLVGVVDFGRVDVVAEIFLCNFPAIDDAVMSAFAGDEAVDDLVADLQCLMFLPRILGKLSGGVSDDPKIDEERSGFQIDGDDIGCLELKVPVRPRGLDAVSTRCVAKHAVAGHLDVEDVLLPVSELVWQDPFDTLPTAGQALERLSFLIPDEALVVRVPVQLEMFFLGEQGGDGEADAKPVGRPAWPKGLADFGVAEVVRCGVLEAWPREIGRGVDL